MDVFPKFIIETDDQEGDCIILAKCTFHKQLATDIKNVKGGGWWTLDRDNAIFTLYGESHDFGKANIEDIADCVKRKKVFSSASLVRNYTDEFKFKYKNEVGEIIDLETSNKANNDVSIVLIIENENIVSVNRECNLCGGKVDKYDKFTDEDHCQNCGWS